MLLVKISVKTEEGEAINESLFGRVVWATRLETEGQYAVGLEFHDMEKKNPPLYEYIKRLEKLQN